MIKLAVALLLATSSALALEKQPKEPDVCKDFSAASNTHITANAPIIEGVDEINSRYQAEYRALEKRARSVEEDFEEPNDVEAAVSVSLDVDWDITDIKFDTPSVDMKRQEWKFDLPQTSFNTRRFSFDIPEFKWGRTNIGPIKLDLPKIYSKRIEFKTDIPEFRWETTSIKLDIPEFYMHRQHIKLHLPQFKVKDVQAEIETVQKEAEAIESEVELIKQRHTQELTHATALSFKLAEDKIEHQKEKMSETFDNALTCLDYGIQIVEYYGMNPELVRNEDGSSSNLISQRAQLVTELESAMTSLDNSVKQLATQREAALNKISGV